MMGSISLSIGWYFIKCNTLAIISAVFIYEGIIQIVSGLKYSSSYVFLRATNAIIEKGFRDHMVSRAHLIGLYPSDIKKIALGVMVTVIGIFVALWTDARNRRQNIREISQNKTPA